MAPSGHGVSDLQQLAWSRPTAWTVTISSLDHDAHIHRRQLRRCDACTCLRVEEEGGWDVGEEEGDDQTVEPARQARHLTRGMFGTWKFEIKPMQTSLRLTSR